MHASQPLAFQFRALPWRVTFGAGALDKLPEIVEQLGYKRLLLLTTHGQRDKADRAAALLGDRAVGLFDQSRSHVPRATVDAALSLAKSCNADATLAIGGGSTTGLGKALALHGDLGNIAAPTTYAGSEMTPIWGITVDGTKTTGRDERVLPDWVIYDPRLTLDLPAAVAGPSGMNALAQAAVNVMALPANPVVTALALDGVRALASALPEVVARPDDLPARGQALYGACLAGMALGAGTTGLHHRLCHTFGGRLNTPHADTHAILLPYTVAFNTPVVPDGAGQLAQALACDDAALGLHALLQRTCPVTSLKALGIRREDLPTIASLALAKPCDNPRPVTAEAVREILELAWRGGEPVIS